MNGEQSTVFSSDQDADTRSIARRFFDLHQDAFRASDFNAISLGLEPTDPEREINSYPERAINSYLDY
jgi:hypothetical protein